jgi:hypothetical protein
MRILSVVWLFVAMANYASAQEQPEPAGRFYGPLVSGKWPTQAPQNGLLRQIVISPQSVPPQCSVPLLEAQIPKDTNFTVRKIAPRMDALEPMPQVKGLPACDHFE